MWLGIANYEYYDDELSQGCESDHPLQFAVGTAKDEYRGRIGEGYTLISGGGIQRKMTLFKFAIASEY